MELPHMGQHCSEQACKQLDYLPMKCDACNQLFCKDHLLYDDHSCTSKYKKDIQVPVCPLCSAPVPTPRGTLPDIAVGAHIDRDCQSKPREKVFTNKCHKARCKKKELMPLFCSECRLNFCLAHRHPQDHACEGPRAVNQRRLEHFAGTASSSSSSSSKTITSGSSSGQQTKITNFFRGSSAGTGVSATRGPAVATPAAATARLMNGMSEDEALAAALAASMEDSSSSSSSRQGAAAAHSSQRGGLTQEEEDRQLALALQESMRTGQQQQQQQQSCSVS